MALFKIFKGSSSDLIKENSIVKKAHDGYAYFTPDDGKFYIDVTQNDGENAVIGINRIPLNALKADQDNLGNIISASYAADLNFENNTLTLIAGDGTTLATVILANMTGASSVAAGAAGLVPAPSAGDHTKYLRGDGTWQIVDALPDQTGNNNKFLTTNGSVASWTNKPSYTASEVGALPSNTFIPSAANTAPLVNGDAAVGTSTDYAREDHVHPTDTSRAPTNHADNATTYGKGDSSNYGHLKLSAATDSDSGVDGGVAATPSAVRAAYRLADSKTSNTGTVTSVRVQATGPIQSSQNVAQSETLDTTISLADASANTVLAGPSFGSAAAPDFRSLVADDIPSLSISKISDFPDVTNVKQKDDASNNANYRLLLSNSDNDIEEDSISRKNANLTFNPSTNKLSTINLDLTGELDVVGNAYLHNQTVADSLSAGSLIVTGNSNFVQIPTTKTAVVGTADTQLATTAFVANAVSQGFAANDAMVFKGTIGDTASPTYASISTLPTSGYSTGWTYRVVTSGTYTSGTYCEIGDLIIAINDGPTAGSSVIATDWTIAQTNIDGALFKYKDNPSSPTVAYNGDRLLASVGSGGAVKELEINASGTNSLTLSAEINNNTLNITGSIGTLGVGNGGTGKTSWTQYGLIYASTENTLAQVTAEIYDYANKYQYLMSNGAAAPIWSTALTLDAVDSTNEINSHFPILQSGSSLDSLKTPGVYAVRSSGIGKTITGYPRGSKATSGGKIIVFGGYPNYGHQFVLGSTDIFHRVTTSSSSGTNWEETWYRLVHAPSAQSAVGDTNKGVYLTENGVLEATSHTVDADVPSNAIFTDTKNTAGSINTTSKIYLIGATSQADNPQTYSDEEVYTTSGTLTAKKLQLTTTAAEAITVARTTGVNYIHTPATGGLAICASDNSVALVTSSFIANATEVRSGKTDTFNLGTSDYKWKNVYATNFNGSGANLTDINGSNITGTVDFGILPSMYWADTAIASAASYSTAPEVATIKLNGNTSATAASTKNVILQYDSTLEVLNFVFS